MRASNFSPTHPLTIVCNARCSLPRPSLAAEPRHSRAMELSDFGAVFAPGFTLSIEERSALEVQMAKKRVEERLHS